MTGLNRSQSPFKPVSAAYIGIGEGVEVIEMHKGARHRNYGLRYPDGTMRLLRLLEDRVGDINYFPQQFDLLGEAAALRLLQRHGVPCPKIHGHLDLDGKPALLVEYLEGQLLRNQIIEATGMGDWERVGSIIDKIGQLFARCHSIRLDSFGALHNPAARYPTWGRLLRRNLRDKTQNPIFQLHYGSSLDLLNDFIENQWLHAETLDIQPVLVVYDLHAENLMVDMADKLHVFDTDYAHGGCGSVEFIPVFLDIIARYLPESEQAQWRARLIRAYEESGLHYQEDLEPFHALNHYVTAVIKHHFKQQETAMEKIPIYVSEIRRLIAGGPVNYPRMRWPGDPN